MKKICAVLGTLVCLTACETAVQTTSGKAYLAHQPAFTSTGDGTGIEEELRKVASVEPTLTFPARIGLARIDGGSLSLVPSDEVQAWTAVREHLGRDFGEFIPLSPMVARMASQSIGLVGHTDAIDQVRIGAARQHLDAVLIYEAYSRTDTTSNLLSIGDLTIIGGYLLPSKSSETEGYATAMLIDVMKGYPYGTTSVTTEKDTHLSSRWGWGSDEVTQTIAHESKTKAVLALAPKVEEMIRNLRIQLEAKHKEAR